MTALQKIRKKIKDLEKAERKTHNTIMRYEKKCQKLQKVLNKIAVKQETLQNLCPHKYTYGHYGESCNLCGYVEY